MLDGLKKLRRVFFRFFVVREICADFITEAPPQTRLSSVFVKTFNIKELFRFAGCVVGKICRPRHLPNPENCPIEEINAAIDCSPGGKSVRRSMPSTSS